VVSIATKKRPPGDDPTVYPVDDRMAEGTLHRELAELLRPLVARHLAGAGVVARVGANQFIYWKQYEPTRSVAPDVYVLPGIDPTLEFGAWKVWESGVVPSFALEIVSGDVSKDYEDAPLRYAELGVSELVVFDPLPTPASDRRAREELAQERCRWQVYRRAGKRGFPLVERTNADRVRSKVLGCWLRDVSVRRPTSTHGAAVSSRELRLAIDPHGEELVPTEAEAARAAAETERGRRVEAEAEVARLRAEIERLRGSR